VEQYNVLFKISDLSPLPIAIGTLHTSIPLRVLSPKEKEKGQEYLRGSCSGENRMQSKMK